MEAIYQHNAMQGDDRAQKRRFQAIYRRHVKGAVKVTLSLDTSYAFQCEAHVYVWSNAGQGWLLVLAQQGLENDFAAYHGATPPQQGAWERSGELSKMAVAEGLRLATLARLITEG